jgi:hypothetical protein
MNDLEINWWEEVDFHPEEPLVLQKGDESEEVEGLQQSLRDAGYDVQVDGDFGPGTDRAVRTFQKRHGLVVDGRVGEKTLSIIENNVLPGLLSQADIEWAADELECAVAAVMSVHEVESRGMGFFKSGKPAILFERHWMHRRLRHYNINPTPFAKMTPEIVNTKTGGYIGGEREYRRLDQAKEYHIPSALESASWGAYQIMGFHWKSLGYKSAEHYVECMMKNEGEHLKAFVRFIQNDSVLLEALRNLDWSAFAHRYNGPGYAKNRYDVKMHTAFVKHDAALREVA